MRSKSPLPRGLTALGVALALWMLSSCRRDVDDGFDTSPDPSDLWNVCVLQEDATVFGPIQATLSESIPTVVRVDWAPTQGETHGVIFRTNAGESREATPEPSGESGQHALLLGLKQEAEVSFRVVATVGDEIWCSETQQKVTGQLDATLPELTVQTFDETSGGFTLFSFVDWERKAKTTTAVVIIDRDGDYVWAMDENALRSRIARDHRAIYTLDQTMDPAKDSVIKRLAFDGSEDVLSFEGAHSDLVELEPGVLASFGWDIREFEEGERTLVGETIIERGLDGEVTEIWSLFDALDPDLSETYPDGDFSEIDAEYWAHMNYLHYAPEEDAFYATARNFDLVVRVDRATGETSWVLLPGQRDTDAGDFLADGDVDYFPHSVEPTPDGVLLFDTQSNLSNQCSAISEFALDTDNWTVRHHWIYQPETCLVSGFLGNASALASGHRMMTLSTNGQIDEVTADGELVWRANAPTGYILGYAERLERLYPEQ